ncbi:polyadenylation and cleavage factor homolog 4-like isoform X2 [Telopea speciosissima]|uniref:polyadenylation and cleavage factor homolog 4-like isoform X2 n=1 Tax=Telopea speciosissima TaxID=54955 RepID=UPI001CC5F775|nr:polyadenylation and cleavage factor homolog 4-like isoform X2 [Telopea speciosissima]
MEMESSRRSIDRSREPGLKKPRLSEGAERDRGLNGVVDRDRSFQQRVSTVGSGPGAGPLLSRFRTNEKDKNAERDEPVRGVYQQRQHQELVSQYKTAIAELTFNSKPIITNLTIIAGENVHAAKGIAAIICANIIEVPSEQKLPSLYLLDSIVKNIGRDYIKYFAARLPEVFCKAYRQVDSSIHSGMRHLFGTWKGVFPPATLQMIEKELNFSPATNGSSSGTPVSRSDSQSQRPPHSIHVNPKYLEARQRLQQSNRRPQREVLSEPVQGNTSVAYGDYEYGSDLSRRPDMGTGSGTDKLSERELDKTWYGVGSSAVDSVVGQRNGSDAQRGFSNYQAPRSTQTVAQLPPTPSTAKKSSRGISRNWKNSEEEEYMWDDMNFRLMDHGARDSSRRDGWTSDDSEKLEEEHLSRPRSDDIGSRLNREAFSDSKSITQRGQATFGHRTSPTWSLQEPHLLDTHTSQTSMVSGGSDSWSSSSLTMAGLRSQMVPSSVSSGVLEQQRHLPPGSASPSRQSPIHQHPRSPSSSSLHQHQQSHNLSEQDHPQAQSFDQPALKPSQLAGLLNRVPQESFHIPVNPPGNSQNLQLNQSTPPQHLRTSSALMPFPQLKPHAPLLQQPQAEKMLSQFSGQSQKLLHQGPNFGTLTTGSSLLSHSNCSSADPIGESNASSLLSAILKKGLLSNNLASGGLPNLNFQESGSLPSNMSIQPPLPNGPPPVQHAASSIPMVSEGSLLASASHGNASTISTLPQKTTVRPPLPPGPPPSSSIGGSTSVQMSSVTSAAPNTLSNLLSSLVAKGLITTSTTESSTVSTTQVLSQNQNQSPGPITISSVSVSSCPAAATLLSTSGNELPFTESCLKTTTSLSQGTTSESKGLIGIEFKPEIIRESHSSVISGLFDDLPYHCEICGLRIRFEERLNEHMEWHASKNPEQSSCNMVSRRWYANLGDWIAGNRGHPSGPTSAASTEVSAKVLEENEQAVPADESQCVCVLCGELFEDFYSFLRDEWMFKGAVYMSLPAREGNGGTSGGSAIQGPIVHANCISQSSVYDLRLTERVKLEQADG